MLEKNSLLVGTYSSPLASLTPTSPIKKNVARSLIHQFEELKDDTLPTQSNARQVHQTAMDNIFCPEPIEDSLSLEQTQNVGRVLSPLKSIEQVISPRKRPLRLYLSPEQEEKRPRTTSPGPLQ